MKIKLDECIHLDVAAFLTDQNLDVHTVHDEALAGASDRKLLQVVQAEKRVLITLDKGIGNVNVYPPENYSGLVLLRPRAGSRDAIIRLLKPNLTRLFQSSLSGRLIVVTELGLRIR